MTDNVIVGWHHLLGEHEFEETLGDGEGQGSLASCSPWSCKESVMTLRLSNNISICWGHSSVWDRQDSLVGWGRHTINKLGNFRIQQIRE